MNDGTTAPTEPLVLAHQRPRMLSLAPSITSVGVEPRGVLEAYRTTLTAQGFRPATVRVMTRLIHGVCQHANVDPLSIERRHVEEYLVARDYTPWTRLKYMCWLRAFAAWAEIPDPTEALRRPPTPRSLPKPLPEADLDRMLAAAADSESMRLMLLLGAYAGLRSFEIAKVAGADLTDSVIGPMLRVEGKGGRTDLQPIPPVLASELRRVVDERGLGRLFPGVTAPAVQNRFRRHARSLGIEASVHQLRHRYGSAVYAATRDLLVTQRLMRHANSKTTEGYARLTDEHAASVVLQIPGAYLGQAAAVTDVEADSQTRISELLAEVQRLMSGAK
jgi:integrase